jgi:hypothetical protein
MAVKKAAAKKATSLNAIKALQYVEDCVKSIREALEEAEKSPGTSGVEVTVGIRRSKEVCRPEFGRLALSRRAKGVC